MSDSQRSSSKLYLSRAGQSSVNETADGKLTKNSVNERQKPIIFKSLTNGKKHFKKFTVENVKGVFQNNSDLVLILMFLNAVFSFLGLFLCRSVSPVFFWEFTIFKPDLFLDQLTSITSLL